jgi:hypothetical protein
MEIIVTLWTKVNMAHQTSPYTLSILTKRIHHVLPLFFIVVIHQFVIAPLAVTIFIAGNHVVPQSIQPVPEVTILDCPPCDSYGRIFIEIRLPPPAGVKVV